MSEKYDPNHILNMDETSIARDAPYSRTLEQKGAKSVPLRDTEATKEHYTVVLCISLNGEKLSSMIIIP